MWFHSHLRRSYESLRGMKCGFPYKLISPGWMRAVWSDTERAQIESHREPQSCCAETFFGVRRLKEKLAVKGTQTCPVPSNSWCAKRFITKLSVRRNSRNVRKFQLISVWVFLKSANYFAHKLRRRASLDTRDNAFDGSKRFDFNYAFYISVYAWRLKKQLNAKHIFVRNFPSRFSAIMVMENSFHGEFHFISNMLE